MQKREEQVPSSATSGESLPRILKKNRCERNNYTSVDSASVNTLYPSANILRPDEAAL